MTHRRPAKIAIRTQGLALVAVLWIVAALAVMVTGAMRSVRVELTLASETRQKAQSTARGEAAIQLMLQEIVGSKKLPDRVVMEAMSFGGETFAVQAAPLAGLIDLNHAPLDLLSQLFVYSAGQDEARATQLAQAVIDTRSAKNAQGRQAGFEAIDELLSVPGLDYPVYVRIADLVTADVAGSGKVNALAAPEGVLKVLSNGDEAYVSALLEARLAGDAEIDTTRLNAAWIDRSPSSRIELQATVLLNDSSEVKVIRRVALTPASPDGLPWRVFYARSWYQPATPQRR